MSAVAALVAAGFALLALALLLALLGSGTGGTGGLRGAPYAACAAAAACLAGAGAVGLTGATGRFGGDLLAVGDPVLRMDRLSGLFLAGAGITGTALALVMLSWVRLPGAVGPGQASPRATATGFTLLLGAVATVLLADDAFVFLFGYELVTAAFYLLTLADHRRPGTLPASMLTAVFGKGGGALVLLGFLLLAGQAHSIELASWAGLPSSAARTGAYVLLVAGFGAKVGLVPVQVWMHHGYAAAPGPTRAAMSGLAMNVGLYGLWRLLAVLGAPPVGLATALLVLAGVTALLGIANAAVQTDIHRLIAYSSVENGGLILAGYGVALAGAAAGVGRLAALGLLAATLQTVTHSVAKSALFAGAATATTVYGDTRLDHLSGVGRRLPASGAAIGAGGLALAGLPPTVGFVSEWFLLEATMNQFRVHSLALHLALTVAGACLALTAGFAALVFLRLLGTTLLGAPAGAPSSRGEDLGPPGRAGLALLVLACLVPAALAPLLIRVLAAGLSPVVGRSLVQGALSSPWVLTSVFPGFSVLSPSWLWLTLPAGVLATLVAALVLSRGRFLRARTVPAWHSASPGVSGSDRFTSTAVATPTRHVLSNLLGTRAELADLDEVGPEDPHLAYQAQVVDVTEHYVYVPLERVGRRLLRTVKRLQSGRLDAYIAYMLVAFVAMLIVVVAEH